ncbi:protein phosphatase 2C domain-containing protein [Micromonospora sp. NPDC051196]|uniref:protein phosphatase 2C domain-containing protein n=1 Tax=Micromonospora sp. NPDC051196 TaxID=3155281 RepID=UPI003448EFB5
MRSVELPAAVPEQQPAPGRNEEPQGRGLLGLNAPAGPAAPAQPRSASQPPTGVAPVSSPWQRPVVGPPVPKFAPKPSTAAAYRPDYIVDGWSTPHFTVRAASARGYSHRHSGEPRQDDMAVALHQPSGAVLFAVADGVGNAPLSHIGATSVCRAAIGAMTDGLDSPQVEVDWEGLLKTAAWQLCEQARISLGLPDIDQLTAYEQMATTLVAGLVCPHPDGPLVQLVQVGDSSAWMLNTRTQVYRCLVPTKYRRGMSVVSNEVVALPAVPPVDVKSGLITPDEVLLVGTDGFGDPLGDGENAVGGHFAAALTEVPPMLKFANDLDFSFDTWDDDRTLFALWPYPVKG